MKHNSRLQLVPRSEPTRWQRYFVWLVIFITGVVVGVTFAP
jgi:hypothetical protein